MCFFAVVSAAIESVVELFPSREQAEAFVAEVERDEPKTAALLKSLDDGEHVGLVALD